MKDIASLEYSVVETKSRNKNSLLFDELRERESAKITCGEAHFKALASGKKKWRS